MTILQTTAKITQAFQVCPQGPMTRLLQTDALCRNVTAIQKMMMRSCRKPLDPQALKPLKPLKPLKLQEDLFGFEMKQTPMLHLSESRNTRPRKRGSQHSMMQYVHQQEEAERSCSRCSGHRL